MNRPDLEGGHTCQHLETQRQYCRTSSRLRTHLELWFTSAGGFTEDVFAVPQWRRLGIARCLITAGMHYLLENGLVRASLEAWESNHPAVRLYQSLGYEIVNREIQMGLFI